ncbi:hypothetical protein AB0J14_04530 [Micromonospora arborensis]|uniref:hypothetical protein n=1 Tax=Micromonospora arborensis TaxID=2116518 RepID=UPI0033EB0791
MTSTITVLDGARILRDGGRLSEKCKQHPIYTTGCRGCQQQASLRYRARTKARAYGWWQPAYVDATDARAHIIRLHEQHDMSLLRIAHAAKLSQPTIRRIADGEITRCGRDTIAQILTVTPAPPRPYNGTTFAIGAARRLQAFAYQQYTTTDLAPMLNCKDTVLRRWRAAHHAMISLVWHDAIAALSDRLSTTTGPSPRAHTYAQRMGWVPLAAWDDIDDPAVGPSPLSLPGAVSERRLSPGLVHAAVAGRIPLAALTDAEQQQVWLRWNADRAAAGQPTGAKPFGRYFHVNEWHARRLRDAAQTPTNETAADGRTNERNAA